MQSDYLITAAARAATVFPVISGYHLDGARVASLTIEGNRDQNPPLNGCRGAGIFFYRGHHAVIEDCIVRDYNGDGISFQQSNDVRVERCRCLGNAGLGIHPGSGSQRPIVLDCVCEDNGQIGLYLCWRVKDGRFERLTLRRNGRDGVSIGHKDTDNEFADIRSEGNGRYGIHFRDEAAPLAGHRNRFQRVQLVDNGVAAVRVDGATTGLHFDDVTMADTRADAEATQRVGISLGPRAADVALARANLAGQTRWPIRRDAES
jgi:hypothetical protein